MKCIDIIKKALAAAQAQTPYSGKLNGMAHEAYEKAIDALNRIEENTSYCRTKPEPIHGLKEALDASIYTYDNSQEKQKIICLAAKKYMEMLEGE